MHALFNVLLIFLSIFSAASYAVAGGPRTILLLRPVVAKGGEPASNSLFNSLRACIREASLEVVDPYPHVQHAEAARISSCGERACAAALGRTYGADLVAFGTIEAHNTSLSIRIQTIHSRSGDVVGTSATHVIERRGASSLQLARDIVREVLPSATLLHAEGKALLRCPAEDATRNSEALTQLRRAAWLGSDSAAFILGYLHERGKRVATDTAQAVSWYALAGERGFAPAQFNLACLLEGRSRTAAEWGEVIRWYHAAADQGFAKAQLNLGYLYSQGTGIERDEVKAYRYYRLAAAQGDATAAANHDILLRARAGASGDTAAARSQLEQRAAAPQPPAYPASAQDSGSTGP